MNGRYFLRIRGSTLGPLRTDQVRQLLQRGKISPLHEISTDRTTWWQLQDCPEFVAFAPRAAGMAPAPSNKESPGSTEGKPQDPNTVVEPCSDPGNVWYYEHDGQARGPVEQALMVSLIQTGRIGPDTLVRSSQWSQWSPLHQTLLARHLPRSPMPQEQPSASPPPQREQTSDTSSAWIVVGVIVLIIILLVAASDTNCESTSHQNTRYVPVPIYRRPVKAVPGKPARPFTPRKAAPVGRPAMGGLELLHIRPKRSHVPRPVSGWALNSVF